jgi:hypothetical protein
MARRCAVSGKRLLAIVTVGVLVAGTLAVSAPSAPADAVKKGGWSALGSGISDGTVFQIAPKGDGSLFVGGSFSSARGTAGTRYVAQWNPSTAPEQWVSVSGGVTTQGGQYDGVYTVAYESAADRLWIGGNFLTFFTGGGSATRIAMWEASTSAWTQPAALGAVSGGDGVEHLVLVDGKLYIGGDFNRNMGLTQGLVVFNGSTLGTLGSGINSYKAVNGMMAAGNGVIVSGQFASVNGADSAARVAQWDGTEWLSGFGGNTSGPRSGVVAAVVSTSAGVFIGGNFPGVSDSATTVANTKGIAFWNSASSTWESIGTVEGAVVEELSVIGNYLYAGGVFTSIGGVEANNIARYDLTSKSWEPIVDFCLNGVNGVVRTIIDSGEGDGSIYVGGAFTQAGGVANADRIAKYSPGAPSCPTSNPDLPPLDLPAPDNFRLTGITRGRVDGRIGVWAHLGWDVPFGSTYRLFLVSTQGRYGPDGFTETANHSNLSCWADGDTCAIFFPYTSNSRGMDGRQYHQVVYTLQGYSPDGLGLTAKFGPLAEEISLTPGPPLNVQVKAGWRSVTVTWDEPADFGVYGFATNYLARSSRGNVCITRVSTVPPDSTSRKCRVGSLRANTNYTFKAQALSPAGWGPESDPSESVVPFDLAVTSAERNRPFLWQLLGTRATWSGVASAYPPGTAITPVVKIGNGPWRADSGARVRVSGSGQFRYSRDFGRDANNSSISVKFEVGNAAVCAREEFPAVPCGATGESEVNAVRR